MDLQAIEARLEAASPGPWTAQPFEDEGSPIVGSGHEVGLVAYALRAGAVCDKWYDKPQCEADSEFIAHAPEDIRALLAEVHAQKQKLEAAKKLHVIHDCSRAVIPCHRFFDGMCSKENLCEECGRPYPCLTARALGVTE